MQTERCRRTVLQCFPHVVSYLKLQRVGEGSRVVEDPHVEDIDSRHSGAEH